MKAYKITGKLGDICSFVGGNEVKKGDMVYFHSESDMKQQCVAKTQENDMSIEAMKQALEALDRCGSENYSLEREAIESLRKAIEQVSSVSSIQSDKTSDAEKQQPFGYLWPTGRHPEFRFTQQLRDGVEGTPVYTTPLNPVDSIKSSKTLDAQPQREWVALTDEETNAEAEKEEQAHGFIQGALWAEHILKERNHVN